MASSDVPFTDLLSAIVDNRGRTCPTSEDGLPLIATNCIKNDALYPVFEKIRHVSTETYNTWFRGHPEPDDIIFVCKGSPGRVCMTPDPVSFCIAQDMVAVRADPEKIYPRYLFAVLRSSEVQRRIGNMHVGTLIPHFKKGDFNRLRLPVPDRLMQEFIGDVYYLLSLKIELNRRMNRTLEKMAAAIFKSWYIDFDPVHAKAEGRDPNLPANIADLFPDTFEASDLGPIPKGWTPGKLADVADNPRRTVKPSDVPPTTPYIGLQHMPRRCIALDAWGRADEVGSGKSQFKEGEILFGKLRPYFHKVGIAPVDGVCSTDILVVVPKSPEWQSYVLSLVSSKAFVDYTDSHSAGTKMPRTNWKDMGRYPLALPPEPLAKAFQGHVAALHQRIGLAVRQNRRLASLRDTLLPKLLSGEIELPEAEALVEGGT